MAFGSGSSFATERWMRRSGSPSVPQALKVGNATLLHQHSSSKPVAHSGLALAISIRAGRASFFSFVEGIGGGYPPLGPHPPHPQHSRQTGPDGLPGNLLIGEAPLGGGLRSHIQSPQARLVSELPRRAVEHLSQSLGALPVECVAGFLGARGAGRESEKAAIVEGVDGVPGCLRAASQTPGDLRRRESARACQKYLATAHHESVFGAQPRFEALALVFRKRTYKYWRFHANHYSSSHTTFSEEALANGC